MERAAAEHPVTERILARFPHAAVILIEHYKDVFCRRGQDYVLQHGAQNLILAKKRGTLLYEGAPVCQSFGNDNFYYTSCVMNCVYDCEYCYLKGMYPSGNLVIFVNLEDIFAETKRRLAGRPMYLCVYAVAAGGHRRVRAPHALSFAADRKCGSGACGRIFGASVF